MSESDQHPHKQVLREFDWMRQKRNDTDNPDPDKPTATANDVADGIRRRRGSSNSVSSSSVTLRHSRGTRGCALIEQAADGATNYRPSADGMMPAAAAVGSEMVNPLGTYGIWRPSGTVTPDLASELDALGFSALWLGGSPGGDLQIAEDLLDASERIVVATGIVNMWIDEATTIASAYHRIARKHPGRFLLGVGVGHPEATATYQKPYAKIVGYLDELDRANVPQEDLALAALGPQVLRLAEERTAGAHPYLTTPEHTTTARAILGEKALLAPEHKVVLEPDPQRARAIGRSTVASPYLGLTNYRNNLLRTGWTEQDLADGGSDTLIDALVAHGSAEDIAAGLRAHRDAGADHVAIQVLGDDPAPGYRALADALKLTS